MMKKIWNHIDDTWYGPKRNHIYAKRALENEGEEAYCRHCGSDILYRSTGYTSWPGEYEGRPSINSGYIYLADICDHCGELNHPLDNIYFDALNSKDGMPIEDFHLRASQVFTKGNWEEYLEEFEKEGHVTWVINKN